MPWTISVRLATCDTCGEPATNFARDMVATDNHKTGFQEAKPIGKLKAGCDRHPVKSETFRSNGGL